MARRPPRRSAGDHMTAREVREGAGLLAIRPIGPVVGAQFRQAFGLFRVLITPLPRPGQMQTNCKEADSAQYFERLKFSSIFLFGANLLLSVSFQVFRNTCLQKLIWEARY